MKGNLCKGAAMAVVGWWTGYKLGGVVALNTAEFFQQSGFENYWQITFLILGIVIICCNIGLLFVNEPQPINRTENQKNDKLIEDKLGAKILQQNCCMVDWYSYWPCNKFLKKWF